MKQLINKFIKFSFFVTLIKLVLFVPVLLSLTDLSYLYYGKKTNKSRIILVGSSNLDHNYDYNLLNQYFQNIDIVG